MIYVVSYIQNIKFIKIMQFKQMFVTAVCVYSDIVMSKLIKSDARKLKLYSRM